ncbi:hypothetical protein ACFZAR_43360 [Streptomyces sp. NPDC008222]|uniref:hypothetical protein n=1 Tax=Streptomyces sp. NPDC008222 TaxID=3364820 RepID=UPI0036E18698
MEELREDHDDGTVARVAAIDIAKASGLVCLRVPHDPSRAAVSRSLSLPQPLHETISSVPTHPEREEHSDGTGYPGER